MEGGVGASWEMETPFWFGFAWDYRYSPVYN